MKKKLQKIKWNDVRLILLCGVLAFIYAFSNKRSEERKIEGIDVYFEGDETNLVRISDIQEAIELSFPKTDMVTRTSLDLNKIENSILENKLIKQGEVYLSIDGKIKARVWQKKAIGRVVYEQESYYIDEMGSKMPLSSNFAERIPIIHGNINKEQMSSLKELLDFINNDEFLKKDIAEIIIQSNESIVLLSRLNNYSIIFGGFDEIEKKMINYKTFVQYSIDDNVEVDSYKTINLRFTQQVVCTK